MSLSSSSLERVAACPASTRLPQHRFTGDDAKYGTRNHDEVEAGTKQVRALEGVTISETEPSYVIDVKKRTVTQTGHHRQYGELGEWQIGTTPDLVGLRSDNTLIVRDYKSRKRVESAATNLQVRTQVLAVATVAKASSVNAGLIYLNDGEEDLADFGLVDFSAIWADLTSICQRIDEIKSLPLEQLKFNAGSHCTYCDGLLVCPTQRAMVKVFSSQTEVLTQEDLTAKFMAMTDEQIEIADDQIHIIDRMLEMAKSARFARLEVGPVKLKGGKYLKLVSSSNKRTDWPKLDDFCKDHGAALSDFQSKVTYQKPMRTNKP